MTFVTAAIVKKYNDCHLKPYYPEESFEAEIKEFDSIGFENRAAPYISVSKVDASYKDPYPWDNERTELLKPLTEGNWDENDIWQNRIRRMINKLVHKLDALQYHSHSFEHFEGKTEESWKKYIVGNTTMNKIYDDPHLIYIWADFLPLSIRLSYSQVYSKNSF